MDNMMDLFYEQWIFFMNGKMLPFLNYSELVRFSARTQLVHDDRFLASPDGH